MPEFDADLTKISVVGYCRGASAKSEDGIGLLKFKGAQAPIERFFIACCFMVGCAGVLSSAPFPLSGKSNPNQPATISLDSDDGEIQLSKEAAMPNHTQVTPIKNTPSILLFDENNNTVFVLVNGALYLWGM